MKLRNVLGGIVLAAGLSLGPIAAQASCTATGFYVDGINMTAALVNPGDVTGTVNAAGCNIGVYYDDGTTSATVNAADISGANYFGVVVNGGAGAHAIAVNVTGSAIHGIGETPLTGAQHGNAIFYMNASTLSSADDSRTCGATTKTTGTISGNTVSAYQKNGITAKCPGVSVTITGNTVTGAGAVTDIAQNGIEVGVGAAGSVKNNSVSENEYTGDNNADSSGILVFGGSDFVSSGGSAQTVGLQVVGNTLTDNDVGIYSVNSPASTATDNKITGNTLNNPDVTNVSGCGHYCSTNIATSCSTDADCGTGTCIEQGYQAGISEVGNGDKITGNSSSGAGYATNGHICGDKTSVAILATDTSGTKNKVKGNQFSP
jgi:parallel beta-helix repeat protein